MSTLNTTNIKHAANAGDANLVLAADGTSTFNNDVTIDGDLSAAAGTFSGTTTVGGTVANPNITLLDDGKLIVNRASSPEVASFSTNGLTNFIFASNAFGASYETSGLHIGTNLQNIPNDSNAVIQSDGTAKFGKGNITLNANGNATFDGIVRSTTWSRFVGSDTGIWFSGNSVIPTLGDAVGNAANNIKDLGSSAVRWRNIYGTVLRMGDVVLELDQDNPANYTTTMVDGEEQQVYSGPTLDVKDRILNLISRLDALEANEVIDDATDVSLLQLVASATTRLDSLEARLTALEGGN